MKSPFIPLPFLSGPSPSFNPPLPLQFTLFLMLILSSSLPLSYYLFFSLVITHFLLLYLLSYFLSFSLSIYSFILLSLSRSLSLLPSGPVMHKLLLDAKPRMTQFTGSSKVAEILARDLHGKLKLEDAGWDWKVHLYLCLHSTLLFMLIYIFM